MGREGQQRERVHWCQESELPPPHQLPTVFFSGAFCVYFVFLFFFRSLAVFLFCLLRRENDDGAKVAIIVHVRVVPVLFSYTKRKRGASCLP